MATAKEEHRDHNVASDKTVVSAPPSDGLKAVKVEAEENPISLWDDNNAEYHDKYRKYQADYLRRIKAKYFSKLAIDGTQIFSEEVTIESELVKAGRFPCTSSFTNLALNLEDQNNLTAPAAETSSMTYSGRKNIRRSN